MARFGGVRRRPSGSLNAAPFDMNMSWISPGKKGEARPFTILFVVSIVFPRSLSRGKTWLKCFYGLTKPYDFNRAFPFTIAIILLLSIVGAAGTLAIAGELHWGTYRFDYFVYIGALAVAGALLSFAPVCAWLLIVLCLLEFSLGIGTQIVVKTLFPTDSVLLSDIQPPKTGPRFVFHPLLQGIPTPNFFRSLPFKIQHDSYGLRGSQRDKETLQRQIVIATVGGSTTYDVAVADEQTWSAVLERELGDDYAVLNHGVLGYSTVENLIQTLFYLNSYDVKPQCAVYYVGWNDIRNAHLPNLDPAYADYHLLGQLDLLQVRRLPEIAHISPIARTMIPYLQAFLEIRPVSEDYSGRTPQTGSDVRLEEIFRAHLQAIAEINNARGITSIFIGQVLNRAQLKNTTSYGWLPLVRDVDVWPLQARFNAILKETADELGSPEFVPPIDAFEDDDFADKGHFSPAGAAKFATMLAPLVKASCKKK
jgi:lysophospholipase L1-like esterase